MTIEQILKSLEFSSYVANRKYSPDRAPESWGKIYGEENIPAFEIAFQLEKEMFKKMKEAEKVS